MTFLTVLTFISAGSFLFYGFNCLLSTLLKNEFIRFGLSEYRVLTGYLQLLGSIGLLIGWYVNSYLLASISAGGLAVLMLLGCMVRLKVKDPVLVALPSIVYTLINSYIAYLYWILY